MYEEFTQTLGGLDPKKSIEKKVLPFAPQATQNEAKAGKLATKEVKYFMRKVITGDTVEFDFTGIPKTKGVTNLENGAIPNQSTGIVKRVEVRYHTSADITVLTAKPAPLATTDDPALINAELEVNIGDTPILKNAMNNFNHSPNLADQAAVLANGFNLTNHEPYKGNDVVKATLRCGSTLQSSTNAVMEIAIICEELIKNRSI